MVAMHHMTTKDLAEEYRKKLGLRTWEEHAQWAKERAESKKPTLSPEAYKAYLGRQTGRTTRGLLYAIARAIFLEVPDLIVEGHNENHEEVLVHMARGLVSQLRLNLRVVPYRRSRTVHYKDHEH
jgi:hypothetical protein